MVDVAFPAVSEDEYKFVEVELVVEAFVAKRLVDVALPRDALPETDSVAAEIEEPAKLESVMVAFEIATLVS